MGKLKVGEYNSYLRFYINGERIGDELNLRINIQRKKNQREEEIKKHIDQIRELRDNFNLNEEDYSDEMLYDALKKNDFDIEQTFSSLF